MKTLARHSDKAEILRRLKRVRPESTRRWGRMSAHQMVCHHSDSFLAVTGQKPVSHAAGLLQRTMVKWIALYSPLPWPAGIPTRPEVDQELGGTTPADFAADVAQLEALVEHITTETRTFEWQLHPIFGRLSERAWMRWAYLHMDHHLRQFGAQNTDMRSGIKLLDDVPGTGPLVERQRTYLMRLKMWLNKGEPVRWNQPWGLVDRARLEDDGTTLISDLYVHRESLINGLFYGIDGMRIGGTRRLKISPHMAYGPQGVPGIIPENAVLVAEVTILEAREIGTHIANTAPNLT